MNDAIKNQIRSIFNDCSGLSEEQVLDDAEDQFGPQVETLNRLASKEIEDHAVHVLR